jgi:hypothetical protein
VGELNYSGIAAYDQYTFGYRLETREGALAYFFRGTSFAPKKISRPRVVTHPCIFKRNTNNLALADPLMLSNAMKYE